MSETDQQEIMWRFIFLGKQYSQSSAVFTVIYGISISTISHLLFSFDAWGTDQQLLIQNPLFNIQEKPHPTKEKILKI